MFGKKKRMMSLDDYASKLLRNEEANLPTMPPAEVQMRFTGKSQVDTMRQAVDFLQNVERGYQTRTGRSLENAQILDFGCGWGRMLRLLPFFTNHIYGCDPLQDALDLCERHHVPGDLRRSDYLPTSLPFPDASMDAVLAYSIFTHTSETATLAALDAVRRVIAPGGVVAITIRPRTYWLLPRRNLEDEALSSILEKHDSHGFSYLPHNGPKAPPHYGQTSMTLDWLKSHAPNWQISLHDRDLEDRYQRLVFLSPT
jgi:SAM-dependent methyltransferase